MSKYRLKDFRQAILGSFVTVLFFYALRAGEHFPFISMTNGTIITVACLVVLYNSFKNSPNGEHFFQNIFVVFGFNVILTILFGLASWEDILANPIGSPAMISTWMALPVALLFDKYNVESVLSRYFVRGIK